MTGFALLFSGQGTQHPDMLPWLDDDDDLVRGVEQRLGIAHWRAALADRAWSIRNVNAQLLLTGLALAAWRQLSTRLPRPAAVAGYSVGELAGFSMAGVFDARTALCLARDRAQAMDASRPDVDGGLMAVSDLDESRMERLLHDFDLDLSIRNGPSNVVLGGRVEDLVAAEHAAVAAGGRCTRLGVAVASHSRWMQDAAARFARTLEQVDVHAPSVALFSNAAGRVHDPSQARTALAQQLQRTVRWDECMQQINDRQVSCVLEIGPGRSLANLWNARHRDVPARSCDDFRSAGRLVEWIEAHQGER